MSEIFLIVAAFTVGFQASTHQNDEPQFTFRDGCVVQSVKAPGGGYASDSMKHCESLPRVYNGKSYGKTA